MLREHEDRPTQPDADTLQNGPFLFVIGASFPSSHTILADFAIILDNSLPLDVPDRIIASKNVEYPLKIENKLTWKKIERTAAHG